MSNSVSLYVQILSLSAFCVLFTFSVLAFCNVECLKIKSGRNIQSGVILLVTAIVFLINN
jgi:hypothetical protein